MPCAPHAAGGSQDLHHSVHRRRKPRRPALRMPQAGARMPITPYATGKTQDTRHSVCHGQNPGYPSLRMPQAEARASSTPYAVGRSQGIQCHGRRGRKYRKTPVCPAPARTRPGIWLPAPSAAQCPGRLSPVTRACLGARIAKPSPAGAAPVRPPPGYAPRIAPGQPRRPVLPKCPTAAGLPAHATCLPSRWFVKRL